MAQQLLLDDEDFVQATEDDGRHIRAREARAAALKTLGQDSVGVEELLGSDLMTDEILLDDIEVPAGGRSKDGHPDPGDIRAAEAPRKKGQWLSDDFIWPGLHDEPAVPASAPEEVGGRGRSKQSDTIVEVSPLFRAREINPEIRPQVVTNAFKVRLRHRRLLTVLLVLVVLLAGGGYFLQQENTYEQLKSSLEQGVDSWRQLNFDTLLGLKDKLSRQLNRAERKTDSHENVRLDVRMAGLRERLQQIRAQQP